MTAPVYPRAWTTVAYRGGSDEIWQRVPGACCEPEMVGPLCALGDIEQKLMHAGTKDVLQVRAKK